MIRGYDLRCLIVIHHLVNYSQKRNARPFNVGRFCVLSGARERAEFCNESKHNFYHMAQNQSSTTGGVGFFGLLFLIFLILKLIGVISWSWWWVTAPLWGGFALVAALLLGWLLISLLVNFAQSRK